ncbi:MULTISPECIES: hypothetical protein [unclassified Bartonella]|uniref:hypothetical protein n=1 Tax=unclassified Bartonella TaxID=2645622 RepID=UPI0035CF5740
MENSLIKLLQNSLQRASTNSEIISHLEKIMEMISPGHPLTLKAGNTLTKQEEAQTLDA